MDSKRIILSFSTFIVAFLVCVPSPEVWSQPFPIVFHRRIENRHTPLPPLENIDSSSLEDIFMKFPFWIPTGRCYEGPIDITYFHHENGEVRIKVETARLSLESLDEKDWEHYLALFTNRDTTGIFSGLHRRSEEEALNRTILWFDMWKKRWKGGDPYSGLAIRLKKTKQFVGHIVLGHGINGWRGQGCDEGCAMIACLLSPAYQRKGLGKEAAAAMVRGVAPLLAQKGKLIQTSDGKRGSQKRALPLTWIIALTTIAPHKVNIGSIKILTALGFTCVKIRRHYGDLRALLALKVGKSSSGRRSTPPLPLPPAVQESRIDASI